MTYDVIVVGAGSGGGVVASRLSEDPGVRVLLLEAGPDVGDSIPDDILHLRSGSGVADYDWNYGDPFTGSVLPRGRVVGGSSAVNATVALRGQPADYDRWAELGASGWDWQGVLPYFCRLEDDADFGDRPYHGRGGPVHVIRELPFREAEMTFVAACEELGHARLEDLNEPGSLGAGAIPRNLKDRVRQSTLLTHIAPARTRSNFELRASTLVDRVSFDGLRVRGVRLQNGEEIGARRVVLAAGAYNTPAILMRSGVGPREQLSRSGVDPRLDLPGVGQNLLDHPVTMVTLDADNPVDPTDIRMAASLKTRSQPGLDLDDLKISFYPGDLFNMSGLTGLFIEVNVSDSRGEIRLTSVNPAEAPAIEHRHLSDARDMDRLRAGTHQALDIAAVLQRSLRCEVLLPDAETAQDDELLRQHLLMFHSTGYHPSGTCRIGAATDALAVVDPSLGVRGCEGLYIADASVMPEIPRGNINLPTMMIGEKAAELIRARL